MKNKILDLFNACFFSIDNGAILTSCEIDDESESVYINESDENGYTYEYEFTAEQLENAKLEKNQFIVDNGKDLYKISFYSSQPITTLN